GPSGLEADGSAAVRAAVQDAAENKLSAARLSQGVPYCQNIGGAVPVAQQINILINTADHRFVGKSMAQVVALYRHIGRRGVDFADLAETDTVLRACDAVVFDQDIVERCRITIVGRRIITGLDSNSCRVFRVYGSAGGAGVGDVAVFNGNVRIIVE